MRSALYLGRVVHHRHAPREHRLAYRVFQLLLDLDETEGLAGRFRWLSVNRFNLLSHHDRDHGDRRGGPLKPWVQAQLAREKLDFALGKVLLLAMPRILGHVFNPLSLYFCHDAEGRLGAVIYEVNNTFGERHAYVLAADAAGDEGRVRQACRKTFRVSPFMAMGLDYAFDLRVPGDRVRTAIRVSEPGGGRLLDAGFVGRRRPLSNRALLAAFAGFPLLNLKVVAAIHFEALKLWLKGVPLAAESLPRPSRGAHGRPRRTSLA